MIEDYQVSLVGITAGEHSLTVRATDQLGHVREREILFEYIPATGMSDEYVMQHFPLPDGEGEGSEEDEAGRPELAVNVMNGNVVYHQRDVEVPGPNVDLNLDRYYNSQLPAEESSEWGEGWTLSQTPKLKVEAPKEGEESHDDKAAVRQHSGLIERAVTLPSEPETHHFDPRLRALVTKTATGHYTLTDESGKTDDTYAFNEAGQATEMRTPGYAKVNYGYEEGDLSEIAVHDPTLFSGTLIEEPQKPSEFEAPAYVDSFGGETSGPGRLSRPDGVAIGPNGHLWVADAGHHRIQEFDSSGAFLNEFGIAGPENGQFVEARAVAVDPSGNVWVADKNLSWIQKFNSEGKLLTAFGGYGTVNGKFAALEALATDSEGHLWTLDGGKSKPRVQEFSSSGAFIAQFGSKGAEDGQLSEPQGIAIDPQGHVWVADTANNRIQEFSSAGTFIRKFGTVGLGNGQLSAPTALSLDAEGNVWVTDTGNNRIEQFSGEGAYLSQYGTGGADDGQFSEPRGIVIDAEGNAWIADTENNRIQEVAASEFVRTFGGESSEGGNLSSPYGVDTDPEGNVWVADTNHNRVQEFGATGQFIRQFGSKGSGTGLLSEPHDLATDAEGNVWVADTGNCRIEEFSPTGQFIRQFGTEGKIAGRFLELWGIAIDPAGHVWAIDASPELSRVQEFNSKGEYIRKFGTFGTAYNQFRYPKGIAADPAGHIWVADTNNNRIAEYTGEGTFIRSAGSQGAGNGQFLTPAALAADAEGNVWVADTENNRVQELSPEGAYLGQFGTPGNEDGQLDAPYGVATDTEGNVWVADTGNDRIQEVAASEFVRKFGGQNSGIGQLSSPYDVATDSQGNVWVADAMHYRLQKFGRGGEPLREVSTFGEGSYSAPLGVATDAEDDLWVAEGQGRVAEFDPQGSLIRRFGSNGTESGQFSSLQDVAVDPEGHVWTIERNPARVQEFSAEGEFLSSFGTKGTESGQLYEPTAIATDSQGNVWVADTANDRIEEFSPSGEFIRKFGSFGATNGHFYTPEGLSVDAKDNVWVADTYNNRIQVFNSVGTYLGQFGTPGNNYGQFARPQGVATDTEGHVWVADTNNNRAQKWQIPQYVFAHDSVYDSSLASEGTAAGELRHPGDVAVDPEGNLWVADQDNNRIEELNPEGEFIQVFGYEVNKTAVEAEGSEAETNVCTAASGEECQAGKAGSGNGQLDRPTALALDAKGDVWVADAGNSRIQEFSDAGAYLGKFGSQGNGEGQLLEPEGVAIDSHGNVWVSDTYHGRVQEFDESGDLIKVVGSQGELGEPVGIDIGPGGNVWVADWQYNRIAEFNGEGEFVYAFGSDGTANGQFKHPDGIAVDARGEIWVADTRNCRIQAFTERGEYIAQFGTYGSGDGQFAFEYPIGIATDSKGSLWITDPSNDRIQRWGVFNDVPANEAGISEDAPEVQVEESSEGFVESVEGEEAGETSYTHEGKLLTAVEGPEGETAYEYVEIGEKELLSKVTLPNGNWAEVAYDSLGRAESVTVSIKGEAKTTYFEYSDVPRRTTVTPAGEPAVIYDIGADGSVLKWYDAVHPPEIEELTGSLWAQRGEVSSQTISPGDQTLNVSAYSIYGIASIQIVANGNQLIAEKTCEMPKVSECVNLEKTYVTETEEWPPGIVSFEVIATDRLGLTSSVRFWDNIPYTPPPDPEVPQPPRFNDVLKFREEFGLDLDIKGNEKAIDERIFKLISDWHDPDTPKGEVARASWERWGVPLRAVDVAELEYRERYIAQAATVIPQWAEAHASSTYAGYYVDHRQGGIIHVGFTSASQSQELSRLTAEVGEVAPGRISTFEGQPSYSYKELLEAWHANSAALGGQSITESMVSQAIDLDNNKVEVKTEDVAGTESFLAQHFDPGKFEVIHATGSLTLKSLATRPAYWTEVAPPPKYNVREAERRIFGGDALMDAEGEYLNECTAGWGATEPDVTKPNGEVVHRNFVITAGHCFGKGPTVYRFAREGKQYVEFPIGSVTARAYGVPVEGHETDAEAIRLRSGFSPPSWIFANRGYQLRPGAPEVPAVGEPVCHTGIEGGNACGTVERLTEQWFEAFPEWLWETHIFTCTGDSGGPYWRPEGSPLGIETGGPSHLLPDGRECGKPEYFTPLLESKAEEMGVVVGRNVGVFQAPGLSNMTFHGAVN
jgi:sugar lactone lactonase YvrE